MQGGTFVTISQDSIESLSPEDTGETAQWVAIIQLFEGLYMVNENYELEPVLADSYEASEDGLTYTFRLKDGVTFHNGDAFTAKDVVYTYEWIMNPDNASTHQANFELVDTVEAPGRPDRGRYPLVQRRDLHGQRRDDADPPVR